MPLKLQWVSLKLIYRYQHKKRKCFLLFKRYENAKQNRTKQKNEQIKNIGRKWTSQEKLTVKTLKFNSLNTVK